MNLFLYLHRGKINKRRKDRKTQKSRSEEKVVGFSSISLFCTRKWESVTQGETMGTNNPMQRTQRLSSKVGRIMKITGTFYISFFLFFLPS